MVDKKNRMLEPCEKNGKFFCRHAWEVCGKVGRYWDLTLGVVVPARCTKCGKRKEVSNIRIDEVPDHFVDASIVYW